MIRRGGPVAALLAALLIVTGCGGIAASPTPLVGRTIDIAGAQLLGDAAARPGYGELLDEGGTRLLMNFWASWCAPCRDEIPLFAEYLATDGDAASLVGVLYRDESGPALEAALDLGATWPTLLDPGGAIAAQVPVNAAPLTLLLDAQGRVLDYQVGPFGSIEEIAAFVSGP
ncbi:MAG: hypothetical protein RLZZ432_577 [Chloroflexota bacterium]